MNKKLVALAVAVAGALAAPAVAFAQASSIKKAPVGFDLSIYGRVNVGLDNYSATGSTAGAAADFKSRNRVYDSGSRLGLRGNLDLGGGLKPIFQIEAGVNVDAGGGAGQNTAANGSTGSLASRDSFVGVEGGWGRVTFGRQSLFDSSGAMAPHYANAQIPWTKGDRFGRVAGPGGRVSNVVAYNSPTLSGFNATLSYAPNSEAAVAGANTDASHRGVTLRYKPGVVDLQWDYAVNQAASGGANRQKNSGNKLSVGWPYAQGALISMIWTQNRNNDVTATPLFSALHDSVKQTALTLIWEHLFGNIQALAMYGKLNGASGCTALNGAANGCASTDATGVMLGLRYLLSKRTSAYVTYNSVSNGSNQAANYTSDGYNAGTISPGADPRVWAVGVRHDF